MTPMDKTTDTITAITFRNVLFSEELLDSGIRYPALNPTRPDAKNMNNTTKIPIS